MQRFMIRISMISFFFSSRRRHTRSKRDWSSDVCSSDLHRVGERVHQHADGRRGAIVGRNPGPRRLARESHTDRKSTRLNSSHVSISYAVFCLKKKKKK